MLKKSLRYLSQFLGKVAYSVLVGLLDAALAGGYVEKLSNGWYCRVDKETGELVDPKVRHASNPRRRILGTCI